METMIIIHSVMPDFMSGIHDLKTTDTKVVDGRNKSGHDGGGVVNVSPQSFLSKKSPTPHL
jgi:hypothetical protein